MIVPGNSNLIFRRFELEAKQRMDGHSHNYDHAMLVVQGTVLVRGRPEAGGEVHEALLVAGNLPLLIRRDWHHEITAVWDSVYYCVFAARDSEGTVVDLWNGNGEAAR